MSELFKIFNSEDTSISLLLSEKVQVKIFTELSKIRLFLDIIFTFLSFDWLYYIWSVSIRNYLFYFTNIFVKSSKFSSLSNQTAMIFHRQNNP